MIRILGVIPARYGSSRFPGKPLADLVGKSMVQRVYLQCKKSKYLTDVIVATDHDAIEEHVNAFGGKVVRTSPDHPSGTDRCHEAYANYGGTFNFIVNIQGDEPFIDPRQIDLLCQSLSAQTELATLIQRITTIDQLTSPGEAKVVLSHDRKALYFSRSPIPSVHKVPMNEWLQHATFYRHVGLYAYRNDVLARITQLPVSPLEKAESLEQLRWLENGFSIQTVETDAEDSICIDTPEDLEKARAYLLRVRG